MNNRALIVVDVQNDFTEGGALAVEGGDRVAFDIGRWVAAGPDIYDEVIATADHHIRPGEHFSDRPDFVDTWPAHCVAGTAGAAFDDHLVAGAIDGGRPTTSPLELFNTVMYKGQHAAAYSGFEGRDRAGLSLAGYLASQQVSAVDIVGIATSHCVRATALSAANRGLSVRVISDLCRGVTDTAAAAALDELRDAGVVTVTRAQVEALAVSPAA